MTIQRVMLVLGLCACGTTRGEGPIDDAGASDGGTDSGGGETDGGTGGSTDINKSGTRIKMKMANSADGAKVFQGSYDSQRSEDCSFQIASDGMTRCVPNVIFGGGSYFADANCTVPAGYYFANCAPPGYVSVPSTTSTCLLNTTIGPSIYARGAAITTVYTKNGAACVVTNLGTPYTVYTSTGAPIAPTSFEPATIAIE